VRGELVARPRQDLILVRHEAISGLGMRAMEMMAVAATPAQLDPLDLRPGDRLRLAVRPTGDDVTLVWIRTER